MKKLLIISLLLVTALSTQAQNNSDKNSISSRPDLTGDLTLSFGLNLLNRDVNNLYDLKLTGSNSFSVGYMYPVNLGNSNFTFNGGLTLSFDKYAFNPDSARTLQFYPADETSNLTSRTEIVPIGEDIVGSGVVTKSKFESTYLNLPVEFRYYYNKNKKGKGLYLAAGASIGYLVNGKTKIKYVENEETKKIKRKESFELNQFRYGAHARIGIAGFGAFFQYDFSELFNPGKGPQNKTVTPARFGLSFNLF